MEAEKTLTMTTDLKDIAEQIIQHLPFCHHLGLHVKHVQADLAQMQLNMRQELQGNSFHQMLHGGVISAMLDTTGGLLVMINAILKHQDLPFEQLLAKLSKTGTVDMRVDFLTPGRGESFVASATMLRHGKKVSVTRMDLHNEQQQLIAVGTGTYLISE